jgi:hypothetical protein
LTEPVLEQPFLLASGPDGTAPVRPQGGVAPADHPGVGMSYSHPYLIPECPPEELLAELDEATRFLDAMTARAEELTLGMDRQTRGLRIEHFDGEARHRLTPTQLFGLLAGN